MPTWKSVFPRTPFNTPTAKSSSSTSISSRHPISNLRLRPGLSLSSYGTNCALFSGIPQELIARAERYTELQASGDDLVALIRKETNQEELKELKVAEEIAQRFVAWEIDPTRVRQDLSGILGTSHEVQSYI